ncbi:membrane protein [Streptomyces albireticuli]|uniref:Membrane protein n=1 Tax=Streptomyces albireticuli TaxID=1940 RepID=A0A1Z2KW91_9ACTN|nr:SHOCT domain-containing protein [Streptomyces albireticuli]ARZ66312.1 membrane protein [Streptomyces albireticuli]
MNTLAYTAADGGPGPWILFFPLIWAAVVIGVIVLLRRTVWRGRTSCQGRAAPPGPSPTALLGGRYAAGEIDEDEYRRRMAVLEKDFGTHTGGTRAK